MFDYTCKNMETSLSAYRKVQLDSFVYVLSIYRKPPVDRTGSYQNGSSLKVTSVKGKLSDFFLSSGKKESQRISAFP